MALNIQLRVVALDVLQAHLRDVDGHDAERLRRLPSAPGEVGHVDGRAAVEGGALGELADRAGCREVVDVHVERKAVLEAVAEPEVHEEVHAAVSAHLLGELAGRLPERMPVLVPDFVGLVLREPAVRALAGLGGERDAERVVVEAAHGAGEQVDAAVGPGAGDVVLDHDRLAVDGPDDGGGHVAALGVQLGLPAVLAELDVRVEVHSDLGGRDAGEVVEAVAAVDVHRLHDRHEAVGWVGVAVVRGVPPEAPVALVSALGGVEVVEAPEVVDVRALAVHELAEDAVAHEVEREHLDVAVAAVLELHAVALRALGGLDERVALLKRHRGGHLDRDVLAMLHRVEGDLGVERPGRGDVYEVEVAFAHRPVGGGLVRPAVARRLVHEVLAGLGLAVLGEPRLLVRDAVPVEVAEGGHLDAGDVGQAVHGAGAAHPEADHADADLADRLVGVGRHRAGGAYLGVSGCRAPRVGGGCAHPGCSLQKLAAVSLHVVDSLCLWLCCV